MPSQIGRQILLALKHTLATSYYPFEQQLIYTIFYLQPFAKDTLEPSMLSDTCKLTNTQ